MSTMLKNRMLATQQASELEVGNAAYETLFQTPSNAPQPKVCKLPISKLHPFFTADIGFKPYAIHATPPCQTIITEPSEHFASGMVKYGFTFRCNQLRLRE